MMLRFKAIIYMVFSMVWAQHFQVDLETTGSSQLTIFSDSITGLEIGDEIGIFDSNGLTNYGDCSSQYGELLVGSAIWIGEQSNPVSIGSVDLCAFGGTQLAGFVEGNPVVVKVWRASEEMEYAAELTWGTGSGLFGDIIQSVSEISLSEPNACEDDDSAVAAFGGCAAAVAAVGCDFVFAGVPISESCPITCDGCPDEPILGCTDSSACNYVESATDDDGSCFFGYCDGSCDSGAVLDCFGECDGDAISDPFGGCCTAVESDCNGFCQGTENDCLGECGGSAMVDDCGVCDGGNADMDCAGVCNGDAVLSGCDNACGSNLVYDECGVCGGDNSSCDEGCGPNEPGPSGCDNSCGSDLAYDECGVCGGDGSECSDDNSFVGDENSLWLVDNGDSWGVGYNSIYDIGGFQFNVDGTTINSASGGDATANGFMISAAASTVIGFSLSGQTIPSGIGNLLDLVLLGDPTGLSNLVISDVSGLAIDFHFDSGGCSDSQFDCEDGSCINSSLICDGYNDCINGIDESDCLDDGDGTDISYENDIQPIFDANCTSYCHSGGGTYVGGLDLTSYDNLMLGTSDHGPIIIPGYADYSILIQKLSDSPPFGQQMPYNQAPLDESIISLISDWINAGAIGPDQNGPEEDIYGCTDSIAENYNPDANIDDGSCIYPALGNLSFSNFLDSPSDGIDYASFNIELDCEYPVSQFEIEISGIDIMNVLGLGPVASFELSFTDSTILGSYTDGYIPENYGSIIEIRHMSSIENLIDPTICFNDSKITTYVGVEYEAVLEGCVTPGCMDEFGDNYNSSATQSDESCIESNDMGIDYSIVLHNGANLVSLYALPEDRSVPNIMSSLEGIATGIIGEGVAASPNPVLGWVGSLSEFSETSGYWVKVNQGTTFLIEDATLLDPELVYDLHPGANLISFPYEGSVGIAEAIPDDAEALVTGIIGEGVAASPNPVLGWVGSLSSFQGTKGYWMKMSDAASFSFNIPDGLVRSSNPVEIQKSPIGFEYNQSTLQAFYFIENIVIDGESIQDGDWVMAYNGNVLVGAREWNGAYTDIPVMGYDNQVATAGYIENGDTPVFKIISGASGESFILSGDIPTWANNELYTMGVIENVTFPSTIVLQEAYPNPFNPTTNIEFGLSDDTNINVSVYDISGGEMAVLAEGRFSKGFHNIIWDAADQPSGIYFVSVSTQAETQTQKLMLIK
ncbi:MAG: T9SS type A sorting domain-containing protein [Candidatus Marinimicrobia bacterium]|nr:T9SS type A sorting domain-containing protein [Candidatus Neomarinimicrobiota bacterium]